MKKQVLRQIKDLRLGDLIRVEWFDASIGKSLAGGAIDVPVKSWGIYLGVLGERNKHIILAQNGFKYTNGLYDIDYTAIPVSWTASVTIIDRNQASIEEAKKLLTSFLMGRRRTLQKQTRQGRVENHELD
jgi:hypothetical protein